MGADPRAEIKYESTPLQLASQRGYVDFASLFLNAGQIRREILQNANVIT